MITNAYRRYLDQLWPKLIFCSGLLLTALVGRTQCTNNNTLLGSAITVACPGSISGGCVQGGRYALVNVVSGRTYTFSACGASWNTLITLFNNTGGALQGFNDDDCAGNRSAVLWTATYTGQLRVLLDNNLCGNNSPCAPLWITCQLNDDPCTATALPVNTSCVNTTATNVGATSSAGIADPSCSTYGGGDVWFTFVAPASGQVVLTGSTVGGSALTDGAMAVYSAPACGGALTEIACNDDSPLGGLMPLINLSGLTSGATYYVRFWEYGNNSFGTFNLCATRPPTPPNDDPCAATVLPVGTSCTNTTSTTGGATNTTGIPAPTCGNYQGSDVWFRVVVPASGRLALNTSTVTGSGLINAAMALYSTPNCSGTYTQVACNDDTPTSTMPSLSFTGLTAGASYYVRVWSNGNGAYGQFNICATEPIINDEPCGAILMTVGTTCTMTSFTNLAATNSSTIGSPGCGSFTGSSQDAWYRFVAPANGIAILESTAGTLTDGSMALYAATSCSSLSLVQCSSDEGLGAMPFLRFTDLVPGATYYIRYWGAGSASGTFNLCVRSPVTPSTNCSYFLELFDSGENGWGTSSVRIQINGGATVVYNMPSGFYANALIGVNSGDILSVTYVNSGPNQNQNTYQIRQIPGGAGVFMAGPTPPAGLVFQEVIDCVPPPAPPEDCRGAINICGNQSFNGNAQGTGFDVDLQSTTFGCLSAGERQGTWYKFSPSASGTIGLTIAPSNSADDYDFAVWGPSTTVTCPPENQPLRCSWSGLSGNTGMRTTSSDFSEDASGDKWVAALTVITGEIYVMYISNYSRSGLSFTLTWQLTNGASLDCTVLPIDLIDLGAELNGNAVDVRWSTATESNVDHYIVERSSDALNYGPIGSVGASGTTTIQSRYLFVDNEPTDGPNYYRVQQVAMDGGSTISPADVVIYRNAGTEMVVFPNPAGSILFASFALPEDKTVFWRILDGTGRLVEQDLYVGSEGSTLIDIPMDGLASGAYTLLVSDTNGKVAGTAHFVKE